ncbi:HNH endonuclease signature motif containing protein [Phaeobacter sp. J2-8]|uniref:HNH endonuclease signature motif containing protein n=1 Tax=Phaeobacter sp. J2-8 TaxID=2931394 RepID=UPI001FD26F30|nr:HNH endonuclease signature motif containing protein [Phaeobacter sp. J2-8]MCJ7874876.1 HNH endonuclease [Phaeobacter sp. J2-8]
MKARPHTPKPVQRVLRQESGFGCASCGSPILDYHHIIEWHDKQHFDPKHMIALCPTCHRHYGKMSKNKAYALKQNPFNIRHKRFRGMLGGNGTQKALKIGNIHIESCRKCLVFGGMTLFNYKLEEGEFLLDVLVPKHDFWPDIKIEANDVFAEIQDYWDIEFKTNWVKFIKNKGEIFFEADFRGDFVVVRGQLELLGGIFRFTRDGLELPNGSKLSAGTFKDCGTGLSFGPKRRIIPPNFAMQKPKPTYFG